MRSGSSLRRVINTAQQRAEVPHWAALRHTFCIKLLTSDGGWAPLCASSNGDRSDGGWAPLCATLTFLRVIQRYRPFVYPIFHSLFPERRSNSAHPGLSTLTGLMTLRRAEGYTQGFLLLRAQGLVVRQRDTGYCYDWYTAGAP